MAVLCKLVGVDLSTTAGDGRMGEVERREGVLVGEEEGECMKEG